MTVVTANIVGALRLEYFLLPVNSSNTNDVFIPLQLYRTFSPETQLYLHCIRNSHGNDDLMKALLTEREALGK